MAAPQAVTPDTLITLKLQCGAENKRTKLPLKDLVPIILPSKLYALLDLPEDTPHVFERYSDSSGSFVKLDDANASVYKQLYRAAKAKLKLRIRVTAVAPPQDIPSTDSISQTEAATSRLVNLRISSPPVPATSTTAVDPVPVATLIHEIPSSTVERSGHNNLTPWEAMERQQMDAAHQLTGINSQLHDFTENLVQDYSAAFGGQLPSFLDIPAEPEMPRYPSPPFKAFSVCCNKCNFAIPDHHWHCGICQEGDFDLCQQCLDSGSHCHVPDHFLVKRYLDHGQIVSSITETANKPRPRVPELPKDTIAEVANEVPGAFSRIQDDLPSIPSQSSRTCNSCIAIYDDSYFVTCEDCEDFDLCIDCHLDGSHGHHPAHRFGPAVEDMILEDSTAAACEPGRGQPHDAICDGCDENIFGVRHKCLECPDFDFCSGCYKERHVMHDGHRFAPIYEPLDSSPKGRPAVHYGVRCDGPLCSAQGKWIIGDRYKCAICHDTDFCANCEALPGNPHNRTHPLIKFRAPVRNVNVTTLEEPALGGALQTHGDRNHSTSSRGTETNPPAPSANASTQAEAPRSTTSESEPEPKVEEEPIPKPVHVEDVAEVMDEKSIPEPVDAVPEAYYVRDYVPDGTKILPGKPIFQSWTMYNPSGTSWPVGCALRWVGGDAMLDVDTHVPGSMSVYENAATSNATVSEVPRGAEYSFSVKMRSPEKTGRAVSYWRLYTPDGTPFGHRLWCDVEVVDELVETADVKIKTEPEVVKEDAQEQIKELSESQMVFPKLEKESPASSTHIAAPSAPAAVVPSSPIIAEEAEELLSHDDVESVTVDLEDDDETTDDGFLTDEEYDMVEEEDVQH